MAKQSQSSILAAKFIADCQAAGFHIVSANGTVVKCAANFQAGNKEQYCKLDGEAEFLMSSLKATTAGSIWGSTSDGVGGVAAINNGVYLINRSGVSAQLVNAIAKAMHANSAGQQKAA